MAFLNCAFTTLSITVRLRQTRMVIIVHSGIESEYRGASLVLRVYTRTLQKVRIHDGVRILRTRSVLRELYYYSGQTLQERILETVC